MQKYIKNLVSCILLATWICVAPCDLKGESHRPTHQLFIYPDSFGLFDYRVELTPDLNNGVTELVFRAADPDNYYSLQIFVWMGKNQGESAGQSSQLRIKRYAVVNGEPGAATVLALPANYGMAPRIVLEVRGPEFRAYANGKLIESWADQRFTRGGFGFFSDGGAPPLKLVRIVGLDPAGRR